MIRRYICCYLAFGCLCRQWQNNSISTQSLAYDRDSGNSRINTCTGESCREKKFSSSQRAETDPVSFSNFAFYRIHTNKVDSTCTGRSADLRHFRKKNIFTNTKTALLHTSAPILNFASDRLRRAENEESSRVESQSPCRL